MIGRQAGPCMNILGMYRWFGVVPQGFVVLFPVVLGGNFRSTLLVVFLVCFQDLALGDLIVEIHVNPSWFFCLWFPSQISELRAWFWGFRCSRVREVLGGISSIPLDLASFGGQNLGYGLVMRCSYYPKSLVQVHGAIREIEVWIWRSWPVGALHPELPRLHQSDRCSWPVWPGRATCGIFLGWTAWLVCFWVLVLLVCS
jgi:hypothetical protein